jgi:hypothetical protein
MRPANATEVRNRAPARAYLLSISSKKIRGRKSPEHQVASHRPRWPGKPAPAVGLTGPTKIGYIAESLGRTRSSSGSDLVGCGARNGQNRAAFHYFIQCPVLGAPLQQQPNEQQRGDIDRKCSVSRMARPQRGIHRFMEEPAPRTLTRLWACRAPHVWRPAILTARAVETRALLSVGPESRGG